jgi:hypothetical protein
MMLGIPSSELAGLRGLGVDYRIDCSGDSTNGQTIDCDSISNFFNSTCWGMCSAATLAGGATVGGAPPPVAGCAQTIITSVPGVCDWYVYAAGIALFAVGVFWGFK